MGGIIAETITVTEQFFITWSAKRNAGLDCFVQKYSIQIHSKSMKEKNISKYKINQVCQNSTTVLNNSTVALCHPY